MVKRTNPGCKLDLGWLNEVNINLSAVKRRAAQLQSHRSVKKQWQAAWLLKAVTCIDLTTLGGDDTQSNVSRLCRKAAQPLPPGLSVALGFDGTQEDLTITTAAVCVYPARVKDAAGTLELMGMQHKIGLASVATGFPSGQYPLKTRLEEIKAAIDAGATEIDIVIDRSLVLAHRWEDLYEEIRQMKEACGDVCLKSILAVGELASLTNVAHASLVAMMAGADFIKTSTGKEAVNATLPTGIVMCRAICDYYERTGYMVGFKPAGGIRTARDALNWLIMVREELGVEWLCPDYFRIGASGLLGDIERQLFHYVTARYAALHEFSIP